MIAFLVDQNFNEHVVDGLIRRGVTAELIRVRDELSIAAFCLSPDECRNVVTYFPL